MRRREDGSLDGDPYTRGVGSSLRMTGFGPGCAVLHPYFFGQMVGALASR